MCPVALSNVCVIGMLCVGASVSVTVCVGVFE